MKFKAYLNNFFWLFLTFLLSPPFYLLIFFKTLRRGSHLRQGYGGQAGRGEKLKILVIQTARIGDLVCTTPVFREIKKKFPNSHLTVLVADQAKDVLRGNPRVDEVILITDYRGLAGRLRLISELRKAKYDWGFNAFPGSFDNIISFWSLIPKRATTTYKHSGEITKILSIFSNHRLEYKRRTSIISHMLNLLRFIGISEFSEKKEVFWGQEQEKSVLDFLSENSLKQDDLLIGISATAGIKMKQWDFANFAKLADLLAQKIGAKIIFVGSLADKAVIEKVRKMMQSNSIDSSGFLKLNELPALFKNLKLFISVDSGPLHIADAIGIPLVIIAGPIDIPSQGPTQSSFKIVKKEIYCAPCLFAISDPRFCKEEHYRCLNEITPEQVFEAAVSLIKTR